VKARRYSRRLGEEGFGKWEPWVVAKIQWTDDGAATRETGEGGGPGRNRGGKKTSRNPSESFRKNIAKSVSQKI